MKRREFFIRVGGALLAIPTVLHTANCGYGDDDDDNPDADEATAFEGIGSGEHSHRFTVQCSDLSSNSDVTYTSMGGTHEHELTLTVAQLGELAAGNTVEFETTTPHTHTWSVAKPTTACT